MKLSELRRVAQNELDNEGYGQFLSVNMMRELLPDIDQAIENAKHIAYADGVRASACTEQHASGWDYRKAVRTVGTAPSIGCERSCASQRT